MHINHFTAGDKSAVTPHEYASVANIFFSSRSFFSPSTDEPVSLVSRVETHHVHAAKQCGGGEGGDDDVSTPSNHVSNEPAATRPTFCF